MAVQGAAARMITPATYWSARASPIQGRNRCRKKIQPRKVMERGLTSQLTKSVTRMPRGRRRAPRTLAGGARRIKGREGKARQRLDPPVELAVGSLEGAAALVEIASDGRGIRDAPVGLDGVPGPERARFAGSLITDRDDHVEAKRPGLRELV